MVDPVGASVHVVLIGAGGAAVAALDELGVVAPVAGDRDVSAEEPEVRLLLRVVGDPGSESISSPVSLLGGRSIGALRAGGRSSQSSELATENFGSVML